MWCPVCSNGLKYSRGFTWFNPGKFFGPCTEVHTELGSCHNLNTCPVCYPPDEKHGLLWIGKKFYSAEEFIKEAISQGISKRITAVPRGFEVGKTWMAHLEAGEEPAEKGEDFETRTDKDGQLSCIKRVPAVFYVFKPTAIEKIVTESQSKDEKEMEDLKKRGITPVIVPDDDKDHQGTVHDKDDE